MATGMAICGFGGGAVIGAPLAALLMTKYPLHQVFRLMGVIYMTVRGVRFTWWKSVACCLVLYIALYTYVIFMTVRGVCFRCGGLQSSLDLVQICRHGRTATY
jgi:hypothetical protein